MYLLLIALSILHEKYDCWILEVYWLFTIFDLLYSLYFLITIRKEHRVKLGAILSLNPKLSPIKVVLKHLLHLIVRMEDVEKPKSTAIGPATAKVNWVIRFVYNILKVYSKLLH